jgi:uncharacterized protein (TIGR02246 family)
LYMAQNKDKKAILALENAYDDAWNQGEAWKVASFFTHDAIIVNPHGEVAEGKKEFEKLLTQLFNGRFKDSKHKSNIIRIHFPKENVAVVDGEATVSEINESGKGLDTIMRFTDVIVRDNGDWLIADTRAYTYLPTITET